MNTLLAFPSLIALALVLWYSFIVFKNRDKFLGLICLGSFGIVFGEMCYFLGDYNAEDSFTFKVMILYYLSAVLCCLAYVGETIKISGSLNKLLVYVLAGIGALNVCLILIPKAAILGIQEISYGFTRVAGPFYWVFQITIVASMITGFFVLLYTTRKSQSWRRRRRAFVLLISSSSWVVVAIFVILMMQLGFKINGLILVPITICFFIGLQIYSEYEQRMFRLLSLVPKSSEQKLTQITINALLKYKSGDLHSAVAEFERGVVVDMLEKCGGNKSIAAEKLGISRATLRRKLEGKNDNMDEKEPEPVKY